jgi:hypothetical protein
MGPLDIIHSVGLCCALALLTSSDSRCSQVSSAAIQKDKVKLIAQIRQLEPWRTDYSEKGWKRLIALARVIQRTDPDTVAATFDTYLQHAFQDSVDAGYDESRPFLLLRAVFELPEEAPREAAFSFKGWFGTSSREGDRQRVNLAWPLSWKGGRPRLVAGCLGSEGPLYHAAAEYRYMLKHFPMRNLPRR